MRARGGSLSNAVNRMLSSVILKMLVETYQVGFSERQVVEATNFNLAINSAPAFASLVRKPATAAGNGFSVSSLNSGRGERSKISSLIPCSLALYGRFQPCSGDECFCI